LGSNKVAKCGGGKGKRKTTKQGRRKTINAIEKGTRASFPSRAHKIEKRRKWGTARG